jgi:pyrimidine-specific ribonucleoside hydrolase
MTRVILDCDPGHDDAIALLLALASHELELLGVTTVFGNQTLDKTTANAILVLDHVGRDDIPVAGGAPRPLVRERHVAAYVHGETGLDGPALPPRARDPEPEHAIDRIAKTLAPRATGHARGDRATDERGSLPRALARARTEARTAHRDGRRDRGGQRDTGRRVQRLGRPEAAQRVFSSGLELTMRLA